MYIYMGYESGEIYIICNNYGICYVGSTIQGIRTRLGKHQSDFRGYTDIDRRFRNYRSSFEVIKNPSDIYLLESYPCENQSELEIREAQWILRLKDLCCITNKKIPHILSDDKIYESEQINISTNIKELLFIN